MAGVRNKPGHPMVEELAGAEFEDVLAYCTEVLELKPIPDEGIMGLVTAFLRCE